MVEDWVLVPDPQNPARTVLTTTVRVEAALLLPRSPSPQRGLRDHQSVPLTGAKPHPQ